MRWIWIDRFEKFVSGSEAWAVKNVSMAEDHLHDHFPGYPVMPASYFYATASGLITSDASSNC